LPAVLYFFFFFQAEDGIRDGHVTGVQTCALPISNASECTSRVLRLRAFTPSRSGSHALAASSSLSSCTSNSTAIPSSRASCRSEIGRASCRERGENAVGGVSCTERQIRVCVWSSH